MLSPMAIQVTKETSSEEFTYHVSLNMYSRKSLSYCSLVRLSTFVSWKTMFDELKTLRNFILVFIAIHCINWNPTGKPPAISLYVSCSRC